MVCSRQRPCCQGCILSKIMARLSVSNPGPYKTGISNEINPEFSPRFGNEEPEHSIYGAVPVILNVPR